MKNIITNFGMELRYLRFKNKEKQKDMADKLNISQPFLSAIEKGRKKVPPDILPYIKKVYSLNDKEYNKLEYTIIKDTNTINFNLNNYDQDKKNLLLALFKKINSINNKQVEKILKNIN